MHSTLNKLKVKSKINNYELFFLNSLDEIINETKQPNTITFIDKNVAELYSVLNSTNPIIVDCNEDVKSMDGSGLIFSHLVKQKANVNTKLVVIGGGILQDLIGFCASTYCRGIQYILVPTTLLAQADSCVGGKTSLNFENKKNILGTFYPPSKILIYPEFINTLTSLDFISGLGEIYKFHILQNKILNFNPKQNIADMIYDGLEYKIDILSRDEFDKGERKFLNFGHTFGHALESISSNKIPHGIAVIIGCMIAINLSKKLGYTVLNYNKIIEQGKQLIKKTNICFNKQWFDIQSLINIVKSDKKSTGKLTMVLIDTRPVLVDVNDLDELYNAINETYESI
jgi:3-dehydroquinate synthase